MALLLEPVSAFDLVLQGSTGTFSVGSGTTGQGSIQVKYLLTHIGLDFDGTNAATLRYLEPVREIFEPNTLEFDEIMQRDIDDARVSSDLVPYLLDPEQRDAVKLFPPIIILVLPTNAGSNRPSNRYPKVESYEQGAGGSGYKLVIQRSGPVGGETFEFQQPLQNDRLLDHDLNKLRLNTNKCKLIIVDGQHRAMALLAIYRNLKQEWNHPRRAPFKDYYEEWTDSYIRQFNLKSINVPAMFCTFPQLDETYTGTYDLKKAAREIFLILNKSARPVSQSRNRLLDDKDLIALFLRDTLSNIKAHDNRTHSSLRIWNVELDQVHDRIRIESPIAITGVNHLYYLIEHLVLNTPDKDVNGAKPRAGAFSKRKDLGSYAGDRLDLLNLLGCEEAATTSRWFYSKVAGDKLTEQFREVFGAFIIQAFEKFQPFELHCQSALWLENDFLEQGNSRLRAMFFDGQGISRVFDKHRSSLKERFEEGQFEKGAPGIKAIIQRLDATAAAADAALRRFRSERARRILERLNDGAQLKRESGEYSTGVVDYVNFLYDKILSTVAFQTALLSTYFSELEFAQKRLAQEGSDLLNAPQEFVAYLGQIEGLFVPETVARLKRSIEVFRGRIDGDIRDMNIGESLSAFRQVVYRGEMQPDQFPKYRYLLLELWRPANETLRARVEKSRNECRIQIFNSFLTEQRKAYALERSIRIDSLSPQELGTTFESTYEAYKLFLRHVGWTVSDIPTAHEMRSSKQEDASESLGLDDESLDA
jgi:hypothetical protein